jgi:hypothetical protein
MAGYDASQDRAAMGLERTVRLESGAGKETDASKR